MYYFLFGLMIVIGIFMFKLFLRESAARKANEIILETLRQNRRVMLVPDIHYVVTQAEVDVSIEEVYHQLELLYESKYVRRYSEPEVVDGIVKRHGSYAIDTITDHSL